MFLLKAQVAVVQTGGAVAERRASRSGADMVMLRPGEQIEAAAELLWGVWKARTEAERSAVIDSTLLRTLCDTGNYVVGAYRDGELIGCAVGFFSSGSASGRPDCLYSFIAGVSHAQSNRGVGYAMKRHQRQWALERDIDTITWTFDPLVARNAYFNLSKLGATVDAYKPDYYGRLNDGINTNQNTDRLVAHWDLRDEWVEQAMIRELGDLRRHACVSPEAELIVIPEDIGVLRETDPQLAQHERLAVRERFQSLLAQGYRVAGMSKAREYVLLPTGVNGAFEA